jgi:Tfp pilus assembly protein FimV
MSRTRVRRRRIAAVLTLSLVGAAWAPVAHRALEGSGSIEPAARTAYVVRGGDTLWSIAASVAPGQDPRPVVDAISATNEVGPSGLVPGQILVIPSGI